jgi:hypothetical protein
VTGNTTPPGVARVWLEQLQLLDHVHGPESWLMRQDGSQVCWGDVAAGTAHCPVHGPADVWNEQALRCPCGCHLEEPVGGRAGPAPPRIPEPRGPDTWPAPRDPPPAATRPVPGGEQLAIDTPEQT